MSKWMSYESRVDAKRDDEYKRGKECSGYNGDKGEKESPVKAVLWIRDEHEVLDIPRQRARASVEGDLFVRQADADWVFPARQSGRETLPRRRGPP